MNQLMSGIIWGILGLFFISSGKQDMLKGIRKSKTVKQVKGYTIGALIMETLGYLQVTLILWLLIAYTSNELIIVFLVFVIMMIMVQYIVNLVYKIVKLMRIFGNKR